MKSNYQKWIHKFGISTSLLLLAAMIGLPVAASLIYGIWPDFGELWPGFVAVVLFMAPYLPSETIGYMSVMGPGALYLSYITGNLMTRLFTDLRHFLDHRMPAYQHREAEAHI